MLLQRGCRAGGSVRRGRSAASGRPSSDPGHRVLTDRKEDTLRTLLNLLTLFVVLALGVTIAGSAFASIPLFLTASGKALSFTGTSKLTLLRALNLGVLGVIDCEKGLSSGQLLHRSPVALKIELEYSGKCEQAVFGTKEACIEPIKFKLTFGELGLLTFPNGKRAIALLLAPESGTELAKVTCGGNTTTIEGAIVVEFPETNALGEKQYNTLRNSLELVFKSESKNENQALTSIELSGVSMTKAELKISGFFGGKASLESTQTISPDGSVSIDGGGSGGGGGGKEPTTLTTTLSGEGREAAELTVLEGAKVKDKATLSGKNASIATGTVKYAVYFDNKCEKLATAAGEVTVTSGSVPASSEEELEAGKTYYWQATYSGDSNNSASSSSCGSEVLKVKAKTSLSLELLEEGEKGTELTVDTEEKVEGTATLAGTNSSSAEGRVAYKIYLDEECKTLAKEAGEVEVSAGSIPASTEEELEEGTYYWQATYAGDGLHQESKSTCGKVVQNVAACTFPYCQPTITPGVRVSLPFGGGREGECTAGPVMTNDAGEKFLLTAGHCLERSNNGLEEVMQVVSSAYPRGMQMNIGQKVTFNYPGNDVAEVKIENNRTWLLPNGTLPAVLVEWGRTRVRAVIGRAQNSVGELTCQSGATTSSLQCGKILRVGVTEGRVTNLIETSAAGVRGDSGGPVFVPGEQGALIQGIISQRAEDITRPSPWTMMRGRALISQASQGTCRIIRQMEANWGAGAVPVEGPPNSPTRTIPAGTTVLTCTETNNPIQTVVVMSKNAEFDGSPQVTFGYPQLTLFEPMAQIERVYAGQRLLVR
jgi:Trypsin